jgi:hypothetical protein
MGMNDPTPLPDTPTLARLNRRAAARKAAATRKAKAEARQLEQAQAQVTAWADRAREATAYRDLAILTMRDAGASLREIAQAAGMAHASIVRVLERARPLA